MFKRKAQSANKNVRRPGQALEDIARAALVDGDEADVYRDRAAVNAELSANGTAGEDVDSADDDDDASAVRRPAKRLRQQNEQHSSSSTKATAAAAADASSLTDPTLVSIASTRSAQPDTSTHSHQHARYAPKQPPTTTTATAAPIPAASLSLPSTQPAPSARFGPQRASGYARSISRIDFQPDICKDWFECGSCGYGDSCKFLHDRLDYKSGWQIEKDWQAEQQKKDSKRKEEEARRARGETVIRADGDGGGGKVALPFACYICRQPFQQPVVTACGHYFCERCALQRYVKTSRCAVCGKETQGSFSIARDLLKETAQPADGSEGSDEEG